MRPLPIASLPSGNQLVGKGCALRLFIDHKITGYFCPGQEIISQRPSLVNPFSSQFQGKFMETVLEPKGGLLNHPAHIGRDLEGTHLHKSEELRYYLPTGAT